MPTERALLRSSFLARWLLHAGMAVAAWALLEPASPAIAVLAVLLAGAGVAGARANLDPRRWLEAAVAGAWATAALIGPQYRADTPGYFSYLQSAAFDHDLDFADEWAAWGREPPPPTALGRPANPWSVGPAIVWAPFYALAHAYVKLGALAAFHAHPADGFSPPYRAAMALGTLAVGMVGGFLLGRTIARDHGPRLAAAAVATAALASPVAYYLWVVPGMAHGLVFGVVSALVWAWDRARRQPTAGRWLCVGALLGVATLVRWQCAILLLFVVPLAIVQWRQRVVLLRWLLAAAGTTLLCFVPQLLAWRSIYGSFFVVPQGGGFFTGLPVHAVDVLVHADHGLYNWSPALLLATLGLLGLLRRDLLLAGGAWAVFAASVVLNGGITDWHGSDAFGARRFDLMVPFFALGFARVIAFMVRRPSLSSAGVLAALVAWNLGFVTLRARGAAGSHAMPARAAAQVQQLFRLSDSVLGRAFGQRGRGLAYKLFIGEYLYRPLNADGFIDLTRRDDERFLGAGWSEPRRGSPPFRWAIYPEACLRLPLAESVSLAGSLMARGPGVYRNQSFALVVNGTAVSSHVLTGEWQEVPLLLPANQLVSGVNLVCFRFREQWAGAGQAPIAAEVAHLQLP